MRRGRAAFGAVVFPALLLACSSPLPPGDEGRREASVPAVPPFVPGPTHQVIQTAWTFRAGDDDCVAIAARGTTTLTVTVQRGATIRLAVVLAAPVASRAATAALRFAGQAGDWRLTASFADARRVSVALGADETALGRLLVLLGGGTLDLVAGGRKVVSFAIGESAEAGRHWFDCARGKML